MAGGGVPCHHQGAEEAALDLGPAGARPGLRREGGLLLPVSATSRRLSACRPRGRLPGPCSPCHPLPHPQPSRMLPHAPSTAVLTCLLIEPSPSKRRCRRDHTTALRDTWRLLTTRNQSTPFPPASSSLVYSFPFVHPPSPHNVRPATTGCSRTHGHPLFLASVPGRLSHDRPSRFLPTAAAFTSQPITTSPSAPVAPLLCPS